MVLMLAFFKQPEYIFDLYSATSDEYHKPQAVYISSITEGFQMSFLDIHDGDGKGLRRERHMGQPGSSASHLMFTQFSLCNYVAFQRLNFSNNSAAAAC